jgi:hypothetical protein
MFTNNHYTIMTKTPTMTASAPIPVALFLLPLLIPAIVAAGELPGTVTVTGAAGMVAEGYVTGGVVTVTIRVVAGGGV